MLKGLGAYGRMPPESQRQRPLTEISYPSQDNTGPEPFSRASDTPYSFSRVSAI